MQHKTENVELENLENLSFEDAIKEMEQIVKILEDGRASLEEGIELYKRGNYLRRLCSERLKKAQHEIDIIHNQSTDLSLEEDEEDFNMDLSQFENPLEEQLETEEKI